MAEKAAKKPGRMVSKLYKAAGDKISRNNPTCPKCGQGVYMAAHKDRRHCGQCGYMEKVKKA